MGKGFIDRAKDVLQWTTPIIACFGFVVGFYFRTEARLDQIDARSLLNRQSIEDIRKTDTAWRAFDGNGLTDGSHRAIIAATVKSETRHLLTREDFARWCAIFFERNAALKRTDP